MHELKISLITVTYNAENTISGCIESVIAQKYPAIEYIVIDGASTDKTINIAGNYKHFIKHIVSEPDLGIYDAMNKGIRMATGDVVGLLNADDVFADNDVLTVIAAAFSEGDIPAVYGDLDYVDAGGKVVRRWRSGAFNPARFNYGWMPPHPTFYCRRELYERFGFYSLDHGTAADYELMLRFLFACKVPARHLNKVMVRMRTGGQSNGSLKNRIKALSYDLKAMRGNHILFPLMATIAKPLRKIDQYFK